MRTRPPHAGLRGMLIQLGGPDSQCPAERRPRDLRRSARWGGSCCDSVGVLAGLHIHVLVGHHILPIWRSRRIQRYDRGTCWIRSRETGLSTNDGKHAPEDLTSVLIRLRGPRNTHDYVRKANSAATRLFLEAGVEILNRTLLRYEAGREAPRGYSQPLTRSAVCLGAVDLAGRDVGLGPGAWTNRWEYKEDYITDLVAYVLRPGPWVALYRSQREALRDDNHRTWRLGKLLYEIVEEQVNFLLTELPIVLSYALQTALPNDQLVQRANQRLYVEVVDELQALLEEIGQLYGCDAAPGFVGRK